MGESIKALENLLRDVKSGQACRYIRKEDREAAEKAVSRIRYLLATMESNADHGDERGVIIPLDTFDKLRDL